jgi:hypothetical protein
MTAPLRRVARLTRANVGHAQRRSDPGVKREQDGCEPPSDEEFVLLIEAGVLEPQALLLVESLRRFGGQHAAAKVTVVSPRASRRPTRRTIGSLRQLGAEYLALDLSGACPEYPSSWRLHALAALERRPGPEVIVQLDSDTVFLGDVGPLCFQAEACARPVDVKGMGTTGPDDEFEPYWSALCGLAAIEPDALPFVQTTVDRIAVRATHNGGFVVARRAAGLFGRADELFRRSVAAGLRPHDGRGLNILAGTGEVGLAGSEWWGSTQAATSVAATSLGIVIRPLDDAINVPVHLWQDVHPKPASVLHAHYHWLLTAPLPQPNPMLDGSVALEADVGAWLRTRLPLQAGSESAS